MILRKENRSYQRCFLVPPPASDAGYVSSGHIGLPAARVFGLGGRPAPADAIRLLG